MDRITKNIKCVAVNQQETIIEIFRVRMYSSSSYFKIESGGIKPN